MKSNTVNFQPKISLRVLRTLQQLKGILFFLISSALVKFILLTDVNKCLNHLHDLRHQ